MELGSTSAVVLDSSVLNTTWLDQDCDGVIDNNVGSTFFADVDGDGFGDPASTQQACSQPVGYVQNDNDCNDLDANQYPYAEEYCNQQDDDCDGDQMTTAS